MKAGDIVLGQTYRIRQWEDMANEFGIDQEYGDIDAPCTVFAPGMKVLCGTEYTPKGWADDDPDEGFTNEVDEWVIAPFMLEPLCTDDPEDTLP